MWIRSFSKVYDGVSKNAIWDLWIDVNNWHRWNPGIAYCKLEGKYGVGSFFVLKPIAGPEVKIEIIEVAKGKKFTDCTRFPGAKMYGTHEIEEVEGGLKLTTTMKVEGWLSYLWVFLVARKIVAKTPEQTENLVRLARKQDK
jgi:hypothetical protein